jgi:hypothetical protein
MATYAQRASSIVTAFLNRPATPTQVNKAARALAFRMQFTTQYDAMTADEKAECAIARDDRQRVGRDPVKGPCV